MEDGVFGLLDVAVTLGFAFQGVASKLYSCCDFGGWEHGQNVLKSFPKVWCVVNFVEAHMI